MKQFLKFSFASCLGSFVALLLVVFLCFMIVGGIVASMSGSKKEIEENSVLYIKFDKPIYDREVESIESLISNESRFETNIGLGEFLAVIENAKKDKHIKAIALDLSLMRVNGIASVEEIREILKDFKKSGKKIFAYGDLMDQKSYYLATVADKIILNPSGEVLLTGMGVELMYIKDLVEKLDVDVDLIKPQSNAYKSAGERYVRAKMSDSNRVQTRAYLNSIWNNIGQEMSLCRSIDRESFEGICSNLSGVIAKQAKRNKIVDELCFRSEYKEKIEDIVSKEAGAKKKKKLNFISYSDYRAAMGQIYRKKDHNIAIVYAYGDVIQGKGTNLSIGAQTTCLALQKAAEDDDVEAIVLRINSPGGDAIASELITNEVIRAKKKKPVVVSMGDYAASAGYEIASNASYIVAGRTTLTGSIGVYGVLPNFSRMLKNKLGIGFDTVKTHPNANPLSLTTPTSTGARQMIQKSVDSFYLEFVRKVAIGRALSIEQVSKIAKGRVWTGEQAKQLGLADELGGLSKAIEIAARKAGLKNYGLVCYPKTQGFLQQLTDNRGEEEKIAYFTKQLGKSYSFFLQIRDLANMQGVQMRMEYVLDF